MANPDVTFGGEPFRASIVEEDVVRRNALIYFHDGDDVRLGT